MMATVGCGVHSGVARDHGLTRAGVAGTRESTCRWSENASDALTCTLPLRPHPPPVVPFADTGHRLPVVVARVASVAACAAQVLVGTMAHPNARYCADTRTRLSRHQFCPTSKGTRSRWWEKATMAWPRPAASSKRRTCTYTMLRRQRAQRTPSSYGATAMAAPCRRCPSSTGFKTRCARLRGCWLSVALH